MNILIGIFISIVVAILIINIYIKLSSYKQIIKNGFSKFENVDCILVLGAGVIDNSRPTLMLRDRLDKAIGLYKNDVAPKIIMSGDHGRNDYDEVNIMKSYAIQKGVPSEDIFMDHAGFCTYDSIYRAKEVFWAKKIIIVTQKYHLYRSLYIANKLNIEAFGAIADARIYTKMPIYWVREVLARLKNFAKCMSKPLPRFLGETISLKQNGNITNDK